MDTSEMSLEELRASITCPKMRRLFDPTPTVEEQRSANRATWKRAHTKAGSTEGGTYRERFGAALREAPIARAKRERETRYFQQIRASWGVDR